MIISGPRGKSKAEGSRVCCSKSPTLGPQRVAVPGKEAVYWAIGQMLDSFPFVFTFTIQVKLKADCWFLFELIPLKRNSISCEKKTWKAI